MIYEHFNALMVCLNEGSNALYGLLTHEPRGGKGRKGDRRINFSAAVRSIGGNYTWEISVKPGTPR